MSWCVVSLLSFYCRLVDLLLPKTGFIYYYWMLAFYKDENINVVIRNK